MQPYALLPGLVILLLLYGLAWIALQVAPRVRAAVCSDIHDSRFFPQLEGLRGLLAACVFLHHGTIEFFLLPRTGRWGFPPSNVYAEFADGAVLVFFFMTGFLFWSKLLRKPHIAVGSYLLGRLKRLGPVYLFAMTWLLLLVMAHTDWSLRVRLPHLALNWSRWLAFTLAGEPNINGLPHTWWLIAGTPWTLAYEWQFYVLLPFLGWFAIRRGRLFLLLAVAFSIFLLSGYALRGSMPRLAIDLVAHLQQLAGHFVFSFGVGMLTAAYRLRSEQARRIAASLPVALACVAALVWFLLKRPPHFFDPVASLLLGAVFFTIVCGNTFRGLLQSQPLLLLGKCSYSLYLCHGLVLSSMMLVIGRYVPGMSPAVAWVSIAATGCVVFAVSLACYWFVEAPLLETRTAAQTLPPARLATEEPVTASS